MSAPRIPSSMCAGIGYLSGYDTAKWEIGTCSWKRIENLMRARLGVAVEEHDWGIIDALADQLIERGGALKLPRPWGGPPVLGR